jgi:hypothetical protein
MNYLNLSKRIPLLVASAAAFGLASIGAAQTGTPFWATYGGDSSHHANSPVLTQPLQRVLWSRPIDLAPQYAGGDELLIHYGSPIITHNNVILWPTKTGATEGFRIEGHNGLTGAWMYAMATDYSLPTGSSWTPSCGIALSNDGVLYAPAAGGTLLRRADPEHSNMPSVRQVFYGGTNFFNNRQLFSDGVKICTPLTVDSRGNVWFGFRTYGTTADRTPIGTPALLSGIAKLNPSGGGQWKSCVTLTGDSDATHIQFNCAPALSADSSTVYFTVKRASGGAYLVAMNTFSMATRSEVRLKDPANAADAVITDQSSASPTVGSDGDVYMGVLSNSAHNSRGYLLHFNSTLATQKITGSFGWDITPTTVPASAVPSYTGTSPYLIITKYNNYAGAGTGDGANKMALLDPNASQPDFISGIPVMKEVLTVLGPLPDPAHTGTFPNAVYEWCVNTTAFDPASGCALVNSEDGHLYRWDLTTNTLSQSVLLDGPRGQAYTPTVTGPTGIVFAINNAKIFAVGASSP